MRSDDARMPVWFLRYDLGWSWTNALVAHDDGTVSVAGVYWGGDPQPDLMDLWVMRVDGSGTLSACDRIEDTSIQTEATYATVTDTTAVAMPTMAAPVLAPATWTATDDRARYYWGP